MGSEVESTGCENSALIDPRRGKEKKLLSHDSTSRVDKDRGSEL